MARPDPTDKYLDDLLKGKTPEEIMGAGGVLKDLTRRLVERALEGEMTEHLGYEKRAPEGKGTGNSRNGSPRPRRRVRAAAREEAAAPPSGF